MKGRGTCDTELIEIIGTRPREYLNLVARAYEALCGHELAADIKGDTSFNYRTLLLALIKPFGVYLADLIHDAVDGPGTREDELIDVLSQVNPAELAALREAWEYKYAHKHGHLDQCLKSETSSHLRKALLHALRGTRMPPGVVDAARVECDVDRLYRAGEKRLGTDDDTFIDIITGSSAEHLQAVSAAYMARHGHFLERAIEKETSGDYRKALLAFCTPRPVYVAQRVHDAVHGAGTKDSLLVRMFAMNGRPTFMHAAAAYERLFQRSMAHDVAKDTSGDYKSLLLCLLHP
jgi:annexin A7/11